MAKNIKINGVTYENVPQVSIPLATGDGTAEFYDTTPATAEPTDILTGKTAYLGSGSVTGSMVDNGAVDGSIMTAASSPSTATPPKRKAPTARKSGPAPAATGAACWHAASRTRLWMPWTPRTGA